MDRAARAEDELRHTRRGAMVAERDRALLSHLAKHVAEHPSTPAAELARQLLPALGRWCVVDELVHGEAVRHAIALDPAAAADAAALGGTVSLDADSPIGLARVLRRGRVERLASLPELADDHAEDAANVRAAMARLATGPLLVVPVFARGRIVGAMTFGRGPGEPEYDELAQRLATDAAAFIALVLLQRTAESAASSAVQAKTHFLTMMSHELRTPLNAIAGYAQLLEMGFRGPLNESQKDAVSRILRGQEHLLELVDAVLTFSRLTSGTLALDTTSVPAAHLVNEVAEAFAPQFSAQGIEFRVRPCGPAAQVCADMDRATEVLRHLLSNALKFTRRGGTVTLGCEAGAGVVRFTVADTGRGIAPAQCESIFQPFVQAERGLTRSVDGSGLGLAVGRELAERMGGTLTVTSELGVGSRFVLTLPRLEHDAHACSIDSLPAQG